MRETGIDIYIYFFFGIDIFTFKVAQQLWKKSENTGQTRKLNLFISSPYEMTLCSTLSTLPFRKKDKKNKKIVPTHFLLKFQIELKVVTNITFLMIKKYIIISHFNVLHPLVMSIFWNSYTKSNLHFFWSHGGETSNLYTQII